jgi:hypothetical protein
LKAKPNLEILLPTEPIQSGLILAYKRGSCMMAVNPCDALIQIPLPVKDRFRLIFSIGGCGFENGALQFGPQSFGVWKMEE